MVSWSKYFFFFFFFGKPRFLSPKLTLSCSWEMSTIGHPLSDLSNLLTPYFTARLDPRRSVNVHPGFLPRATRGLPTHDEITALYFSVVDRPESSSLDLAPRIDDAVRQRELQWAQAFNIFRLSAICQGIAARQAGRQASSEQARRYGDARTPLAEFAWELVQETKKTGQVGQKGNSKSENKGKKQDANGGNRSSKL